MEFQTDVENRLREISREFPAEGRALSGLERLRFGADELRFPSGFKGGDDENHLEGSWIFPAGSNARGHAMTIGCRAFGKRIERCEGVGARSCGTGCRGGFVGAQFELLVPVAHLHRSSGFVGHEALNRTGLGEVKARIVFWPPSALGR